MEEAGKERRMLMRVETPEDFFKYNFGYDVVKASTQAMEREVPGWTLPENFFEEKPGEGVYP